MSDDELQQVRQSTKGQSYVGRENRQAIGAELRGEPASPEESPWIPDSSACRQVVGRALSVRRCNFITCRRHSVATLHDPTETLMDRGTGETRRASW